MHKVSTNSADKKYIKVSMKNNALTIPTSSLPKGWRDTGAEEFGVSVSTIEKVVYGKINNEEIFAFMLELAEEEKKLRLKKAKEISDRLAALTK